jgi:hypothetical protein
VVPLNPVGDVEYSEYSAPLAIRNAAPDGWFYLRCHSQLQKFDALKPAVSSASSDQKAGVAVEPRR